MKIGYALCLLTAVGCGDVIVVRVTPDASRVCDPREQFGPPVTLSGLEEIEGSNPRLSVDELTVYFHTSSGELRSAHRAARTDAFEAPQPLPTQSSGILDYDPAVSPDGLALWHSSHRAPDEGQHLYVSTRMSTLTEFGAPQLAERVNSPTKADRDVQPFLTADGQELWFASNRTGAMGGEDLWRAVWTGSGFATPVHVSELSSPEGDNMPALSADRLTIYFSSPRPVAGARGASDIWVSHRETVEARFPAPMLVDELNSAGSDIAGWISADHCRIYGSSDISGTRRLFVATRQP